MLKPMPHPARDQPCPAWTDQYQHQRQPLPTPPLPTAVHAAAAAAGLPPPADASRQHFPISYDATFTRRRSFLCLLQNHGRQADQG